MLNRPGKRVFCFFEGFFCLLETLLIDADSYARTGAGRNSGIDSGQVQTDDVTTGQHVRLARAAVRVSSRGFVFQSQDIDIKILVLIQIAHGNSDVIDGFDSAFQICAHKFAP
jgi:hypothetical protein